MLGNLYNKTRHAYIYMLRIAGQTAGPIGLKLFVDTQGWPGGVRGFKKIEILLFNICLQIFFKVFF